MCIINCEISESQKKKNYEANLFGRVLWHLWWAATRGKISTPRIWAVSPWVINTSSMTGASCITWPRTNPKRAKLKIDRLCLPNLQWAIQRISNRLLTACAIIIVSIAITVIHRPCLSNWTIGVKESHQIPRRPFPLNQLKHALGTQRVCSALVPVLFIYYSYNICMGVVQLLSPASRRRRQLKTVACIAATLRSTLVLLILGTRYLSARLQRYSWIALIFRMYLIYLFFAGSSVMYFARTANRSMCFSSFVIYTINGIMEGWLFISPIYQTREIKELHCIL